MKKINLLLLAFIAIFAISCSETSAEEVETVEVETEELSAEEVVIESANTTTAVVTELPTFENAEFNAFAQEMDALLNKTITLLEAGDEEGVAALEPEGKALQERGMALENEINEADRALFEAYMQNKAKELMAAAGINLNQNEMHHEENDHSGHNH